LSQTLKDGLRRCNFRNFSKAMLAPGNTAFAKFEAGGHIVLIIPIEYPVDL
jgi:hypothetical protein